MRVRLLAIVAAVCSACLFAMPQPSTPAEPQTAAAQIDFDALHSQASAALKNLQQMDKQQVALSAMHF